MFCYLNKNLVDLSSQNSPEKKFPARARHLMNNKNILYRIWRFYIDGFRQMTVGRYLWVMIIVKVAILFLVFKLFFFPDRLQQDYDTDRERAKAVRRELVNRKGRAAEIVKITGNSINKTYHKAL